MLCINLLNNFQFTVLTSIHIIENAHAFSWDKSRIEIKIFDLLLIYTINTFTVEATALKQNLQKETNSHIKDSCAVFMYKKVVVTRRHLHKLK